MGLPDSVSPEDAQKFTSVLNKLVAGDDGLKKNLQVKALKALAKTRLAHDAINWRRGGGWKKSLFTAESFDSYTGEYLLARLLNTSAHIMLWHWLVGRPTRTNV